MLLATVCHEFVKFGNQFTCKLLFVCLQC